MAWAGRAPPGLPASWQLPASCAPPPIGAAKATAAVRVCTIVHTIMCMPACSPPSVQSMGAQWRLALDHACADRRPLCAMHSFASPPLQMTRGGVNACAAGRLPLASDSVSNSGGTHCSAASSRTGGSPLQSAPGAWRTSRPSAAAGQSVRAMPSSRRSSRHRSKLHSRRCSSRHRRRAGSHAVASYAGCWALFAAACARLSACAEVRSAACCCPAAAQSRASSRRRSHLHSRSHRRPHSRSRRRSHLHSRSHRRPHSRSSMGMRSARGVRRSPRFQASGCRKCSGRCNGGARARGSSCSTFGCGSRVSRRRQRRPHQPSSSSLSCPRSPPCRRQLNSPLRLSSRRRWSTRCRPSSKRMPARRQGGGRRSSKSWRPAWRTDGRDARPCAVPLRHLRACRHRRRWHAAGGLLAAATAFAGGLSRNTRVHHQVYGVLSSTCHAPAPAHRSSQHPGSCPPRALTR